MAYKLESEVRSMFAEAAQRSAQATDKESLRRMYQDAKLRLLKKRRAKLRAHEARAIRLMSMVDYSRIDPTVVYVGSERPLWDYYRNILSNAPWNGRLGRLMPYLCVDRNSGGVMGIMEISSDLNLLGPRDKHIGWTKEAKFEMRRLNNVVNVGTCVGVAPFGWLTGGKFMLTAALSSKCTDGWRTKYGDVVAAVTTTSLFGKASVYNRLKEFEYLGCTLGHGVTVFTDEDAALMKGFCQANSVVVRQGKRGGTMPRLDMAHKIVAMLKLRADAHSSKAPKGVYFGTTSDDSMPFLRGEIDTMTPDQRDVDDIASWWLDRWCAMRWPKKRDEVESFDYASYTVDRQIDELTKQLREASATSDIQSGVHRRNSGDPAPASEVEHAVGS